MDAILILLEKKKTKTQPRILHPWKLPFRKREVVFQKKKKTQKLNITELTLQETLKRVLQAEIKNTNQ